MKRIGFFGRKTLRSFSPQNLSGLIVPLITPMNEDLSVDFFALKAITARLMNKGVRNFFVFNIFSEENNVSFNDKIKILKIVSEEISGRGLLLCGCFGHDTDSIVSSVVEFEKFADCFVVNVPRLAFESELGFTDFIDALMTQTKSNFLLYNNSSITYNNLSSIFPNPSIPNMRIPLSLLEGVLNWERLFGIISYSSSPGEIGELAYYSSTLKLFEESEVLSFPALRNGFVGLSCPAALFMPSYFLALVEGFDSIDFGRMSRYESRVTAFNKVFSKKRIQAIKKLLSLQRLIQYYHSTELAPLDEKEVSFLLDSFNFNKKISVSKERALKNNSD
ncbi:MAG: dihydrodipicolinate synthase family protein [Candidatus Diapherotrites archaeon]|nr:dihydrodipicolinate synthase family protein [Candidatus Diapherotrites archaeon]